MITINKIKNIYYDKVIFLFFLNSLFVVLSYFIANKFNIIYNAFFTFKALFIVFSLIIILNKNKNKTDNRKLLLFFMIFIVTLFFSQSVLGSIPRAITFFLGIVYIYNFVRYMVNNYNKYEQILYITVCFFIIYSFPIIMTMLNINVVINEGFNIYGKEIIANSTGFLSNNLGWSTAVCFSSILTLLTNYKFDKIKIIVFVLILISCLFVLSISGSRSGILCLTLTLFFFLLKDSNNYLKVFYFILFIGVYFLFTNYDFLNLESTRLFDTDNTNIEIDNEKEYRVIALEWVNNYFNENKILWFTGIGFNQLGNLLESKVFLSVGDFKVQGDIHNTYLQFLFENGIFTFLALMFLFIIPSVYNFIRSSIIFYVFIPAMVIPYFENNLNAGQFLFFPFVLCFIYLSISKLNFKNT